VGSGGRLFLGFSTVSLGPLENSAKCTYTVHMIRFEWNSSKATLNERKHGVSFEEAKSVFYNEFAVQFYDSDCSGPGEDRFLMLGLSSESRVLIVCHCERDSGNTIRIISARKATKNERKFYEGDMP